MKRIGNYRRKFDDATVLRIIEAKGTNKDIAAEFGCAPSYVSMVRNNQRRARPGKKPVYTQLTYNRTSDFSTEERLKIATDKRKALAVAFDWGISECTVYKLRRLHLSGKLP